MCQTTGAEEIGTFTFEDALAFVGGGVEVA
jgi:hypothetical protein